MSADVTWVRAVPIAHRGLHDERLPENSLGAFEAAAAHGFAIELDVQLTADEKVVVFHDENTLRMTGCDLDIVAASFAQIADQKLANSAYSVPQLMDVLRLIDCRVPILVELKTGREHEALCRQVASELAQYRGAYAVQSFDPRIVGWFKRNVPDAPRGQLGAKSLGDGVPFLVNLLLAVMVTNVLTRPDFIAYDVASISSWPVRFWRFVLRVPLVVWTVRTPEQLRAADALAANVIFEGSVRALVTRVRP